MGFRTLLEYEVGDFAAGETYLERLLEAMRLSSPGPTMEYLVPAIAIPLVNRNTGVGKRSEDALSSGYVLPLGAQVARVGLALLAVERRDVEAATQQFSALQSTRGNMVMTTINGERVLAFCPIPLGIWTRR